MFIMGMAVTPLGTKLIHEAVEFDAELFYDAHKVMAELSEGILKAHDLSVGSSLVEEDKIDLATTLLAKAKGVFVLLPTDMVIADKFAHDSNTDFFVFFSSMPPFLLIEKILDQVNKYCGDEVQTRKICKGLMMS
nr:3-phosphoglycerate kinase [Tanacetum cinerariifolium]